jgi:hypothetical protein
MQHTHTIYLLVWCLKVRLVEESTNVITTKTNHIDFASHTCRYLPNEATRKSVHLSKLVLLTHFACM